jgi:ABC-type multidrug transport system ATPase subunit
LTGKITINGRPDKLDKHRRLMGFVPQSDIMYRCGQIELEAGW